MAGFHKHLLVAAMAFFIPSIALAAFTDYTGLDGGGWVVDYQLHIGNSNAYNGGGGVPYTTNNSASIVTGSFDRVAYVLELQAGAGPLQYVFASFDAAGFQNNASLVGVPSFASGEVYQQNVGNLHVLAGGGAPVTTGVFANGGNIEFWPSNYAPNNINAIPGANNDDFDTGDTRDPGGTYGSMQIHNHSAANQVLIAFNKFNDNSNSDVGVGNYTGNNNRDWTFSNGFNGSATDYTIKDLQVLVHVPEPTSVALLGLGIVGLLAIGRRRRTA